MLITRPAEQSPVIESDIVQKIEPAKSAEQRECHQPRQGFSPICERLVIAETR
jgi:hypothetical protein